MSEQDRITFEVWFIDQLTTRHDCDDTTARIYLKKDDLGVYVHSNTFLRYEGWNAATAEANKRIEALENQVTLLLNVQDRYITDIAKLQASNNDLREAFQKSIIALEKANVEGLITDTIWVGDTETLFDYMGEALSATPAESLQAHDDELIEKCAKVCDGYIGQECLANDIRALKQK